MHVGNKTHQPFVSEYFESKQPSAVRLASLKYAQRTDDVALVNGAIGNVSLPMHPRMIDRLKKMGQLNGRFGDGVIKYEETPGNAETKAAFKRIIELEDFDTSNLEVLVTDGASMAMELTLLGVCGEPGKNDRPLLMFDPAYTNYTAIADRVGRKTVTVPRELNEQGVFTFPDIEVLEQFIINENPGGILVIPYDNPTGHMFEHDNLIEIAELCVKYNLWLVSDEAYRGLFYDDNREVISIWGLTDEEVPGIEGRRISLETTSKVWNACGIRIGALVTDNQTFYEKAVADYTSNLSANSMGQYLFGAIAHETKENYEAWMDNIRTYYKNISIGMHVHLKEINPDFIVSLPESSIYLVVDLRKVVDSDFKVDDFIAYCAEKGSVLIDDVPTTLLMASMSGFYTLEEGLENPGNKQIRISFSETKEKLKHIPYLLNELLKQYKQLL